MTLQRQTRIGIRSVPKDQLTSACDLPCTNIKEVTTELTAPDKTLCKEPSAQVSWCFPGLMAQISIDDYHLSDRMARKDLKTLVRQAV